MWRCTAEIANRNKSLGEAAGWGGLWRRVPPHAVATAFAAYCPRAAPGRPHLPLESHMSAGGWAIQPLGERRDGHVNLRWTDPVGWGVVLDLRARVTTGYRAREVAAAFWLQNPLRMRMTAPTHSFSSA